MDSGDPSAKIVETVGVVLLVQFEDGSTWGDVEAIQGRRADGTAVDGCSVVQKGLPFDVESFLAEIHAESMYDGGMSEQLG
jgi:hypothetical protein